MTDQKQQAWDEFVKGMEEFERTRPAVIKIVRKILYNTLSGAIIQKISDDEFVNTNTDLSVLDVDQTYFDHSKLLTEFYVKDSTIHKKPRTRLDFTKRRLEPCVNGKFTTLPNNMLFVSNQGDTYDYRRN